MESEAALLAIDGRYEAALSVLSGSPADSAAASKIRSFCYLNLTNSAEAVASAASAVSSNAADPFTHAHLA